MNSAKNVVLRPKRSLLFCGCQDSRADQKNLAEFKWIQSILREMKKRALDALDFFTSQVPPLCTAFGLLMNKRARELSLVQKVNTVLGAGNATKKVSAH